MTARCEQYRPMMFAYVQGELQNLIRTRFEAHVSNCDRCNALTGSIERSLGLAKNYEPEIDEDHVSRLVHLRHGLACAKNQLAAGSCSFGSVRTIWRPSNRGSAGYGGRRHLDR